MGKIILDLCGGTGSWSKPYKNAGYDVIVITMPEYDVTKYIITWHGDIKVIGFKKVLEPGSTPFWVPLKDIYGILAAPPCTMFSIARNDRTAKEPRNLRAGMRVVDACMNIIRECLYYHFRKDDAGLKFWALENPTTGYLERFIGIAPLQFNPCDYGDPYTKRTSLWGEFKFPRVTACEPSKRNFVKYAADNDHVRKEKESMIPDGYQKKTGYDTRKIIRSITPQGFAKAFFEANR